MRYSFSKSIRMSKTEELYTQIRAELELCQVEQTPTICANLGDDESKDCIVQTIAEFCLVKRLTISQAIAEVEKTFSNGTLD